MEKSFKLFLVCRLAFAFLLCQTIQATNLNQRIQTFVKKEKGTGIYVQSKNSQGKSILKKIYTIPFETKLSFVPSSALERPAVKQDSGKVRNSAGRYFGRILFDTSNLSGQKLRDYQSLNKKKIFIYEWSIDKTQYLRLLFDKPLPRNEKRYTTNDQFLWDKVSTQGLWTSRAANIMSSVGEDLIYNAPSDITDFCSNYYELGRKGKTNFWLHLLNSIMKRESAFDLLVGNDESNFGGSTANNVISRGALQISYGSIGNHYKNQGCQAKSPLQLHNFQKNITCGVAIFKHLTRKDGCISCRRSNNKWGGIAAYWSTLRTKYEVSCKICSSGKARVGYKSETCQ
jgi:hypothetical protein